MEEVVYEVLNLMEYHNDIFRNQYGIEFSLFTDHSLTLVSSIPNYRIDDEQVIVYLLRTFETIHDFVYDCIITHVDEIEDICPESLLNWYLEGKGKIYCSVDEHLTQFLYFLKCRNKLYAENELEIEHVVPAELETIDDLVLYTREYALRQYN